jgi:hypothetical protein
MQPYPQRNLSPEEEVFNKRLAKARQVVECSFGILSTRNKWRLLLKLTEVNPERADDIIQCVCLLHNIIIGKEGIHDLPAQTEPNNRNVNNRFTTVGENRSATRDSFKAYFSHNNT